MFRSQVMKISGVAYKEEEQKAFALLREGLVGSVLGSKQQPCLNVYRDQIVWGRSPVRIDLAGGWTDTPPIAYMRVENVVKRGDRVKRATTTTSLYQAFRYP